MNDPLLHIYLSVIKRVHHIGVTINYGYNLIMLEDFMEYRNKVIFELQVNLIIIYK